MIEEFIKLCQNKEIERAYELLSTKCKTDLYPNIEKFKEQYYNKIFNVKREIEIEIVDNQTYKIKFTEDILESGKIEGRESIIDYYKIDSEILEDKLYINNEKTIK